MDKNIEISFSRAENKDVRILWVVQLLVGLREMTLEEGGEESLKFLNGGDFEFLICQENLDRIEKELQSMGCTYSVVYKGSMG